MPLVTRKVAISEVPLSFMIIFDDATDDDDELEPLEIDEEDLGEMKHQTEDRCKGAHGFWLHHAILRNYLLLR